MNSRLSILASLIAAFPYAGSAFAAIPATAPYNTDPYNEYVQDATSDGVDNLNMVLCIMNGMAPSTMLDQNGTTAADGSRSVTYTALVDKNKCDTRNRASSSNSNTDSSGASSASNYMTAFVTVSRANANDPMIAKVWMQMNENGNNFDINVRVSATRSPADLPPYGQLRLDYIGKVSGVTQFNGFIDANGAAVSYLETGANSSNTQLALNATSSSAGSGTLKTLNRNAGGGATLTYDFAFNSGYYLRKEQTGSAVCFDRTKANAKRSVWRYGTYNGNDGTRLDMANPGFPIQATYAGNTYYGFASYYGINFQGVDLNGVADGSPLAGVVVSDQRAGNSTTYNLSKVGGKLTKWSQQATTLTALSGIPVYVSADLTGLTDGSNGGVTGWNNWQVQWDGSNFIVTGTQSCNSNGCVVSAVSPTPVVTAAAFASVPINGWSDTLGGNINIPPTGANHSGTDAVYYYTQSTVLPGSASAPTALYCLSQCPTTGSLSQFKTVASGGTATCSKFVSTQGDACHNPFGNKTGSQWYYNSNYLTANNNGKVAYAFGASGLTHTATGGSPVAMILTPANAVPYLFDRTHWSGDGTYNPQFANGIQTGRLFDTAFSHANCPNASPFNASNNIVCEPANPGTYYTWSTGPNTWNQSVWLTKTSDSSMVNLDPPATIPFTVPSGAAYGTWAGKAIRLQFNGFGNLFGIPGHCVNPLDNTATDCSTTGSRYVPAFALPDGSTMTLPPSTPMIVKALDAELRLSKIACGSTGLSAPGSSATLPSASGVHDPSNASDAYYIGANPNLTGKPKVVDGVIQ